MLNRNKVLSIFLVFLLLQPILDVLTNLLTNVFGINISLGIIVRSIFLLLFMAFVFKEVWLEKNKQMFIHIGAIIFITTAQFITTLLFKDGVSIGSEVTFIVKTIYPIVLFVAGYYLLNNKETLERTINLVTINGIIIALFIIIPTWLNISFSSYKHGLQGSLGLYSSGNEVSAILMFTYFFAVYSLFYKKQKNLTLPVVAIFLITIASFYVGTKVAIGAIVVIALLFAIAVLLFRMKEVNKFLFIALIVPFLVSFVLFNGVPAAENSKLSEEQQEERNEKYENPELYYDEEDQERISEVVRLRKKANPIVTKILSSRDIYAIETYEDFERAPLVRKLFGLGYAGDYYDDVDVKIIEMDVVDYAFSYGIIGTLYFIVLFVLFLKFIVQSIFSAPCSTRGKILFATFAFLLTLAVSTLAGHIWFAPAVGIYFALMAVVLIRISDRTLA